MEHTRRGPLGAFPGFSFSFSFHVPYFSRTDHEPWIVIADGLTSQEAEMRARHALYVHLVELGRWTLEDATPNNGIRLDLTWDAVPAIGPGAADVLDTRGYEVDEVGEPLPSRYPTLEVVQFLRKAHNTWTAHLPKTIHVYDVEVDGGEMGLFRRNYKTASYVCRTGDWDDMRLMVIKAAGLSETYNPGLLRDAETLRRYTESR